MAVAAVVGSSAVAFVATAANAVTTYNDFTVFAVNDVQVGVGSTVNGNVGAGHNGHSHDALNMNGGATINGDAHVGEDVTMANSTAISGTLLRVGNLSKAASATIGSDQHVADADLPSGPIPTQWPAGAPNGPPATYCAANHTPDISNANGTTINLAPGTSGTISAGSSTTLNFTAPGDYFLDGLSTGSVSISYPAGVRLFVCSKVGLGNITSAKPANPIYTEVAAIPVAADGHGFEVTNGPWVGDIVVPTAGIHYGSGSSGNASIDGHVWASFVDIEHGVVLTTPATTTTTTSSSTSTSTSTTTTTKTTTTTTTTTSTSTTTTTTTTTTTVPTTTTTTTIPATTTSTSIAGETSTTSTSTTSTTTSTTTTTTTTSTTTTSTTIPTTTTSTSIAGETTTLPSTTSTSIAGETTTVPSTTSTTIEVLGSTTTSTTLEVLGTTTVPQAVTQGSLPRTGSGRGGLWIAGTLIAVGAALAASRRRSVHRR